MAEKTTTETVTLSNKFPAAGRVRAGYEFVRGESKTLELTKDQLGAFNDDPYFTVGTPEDAPEAGNADESGAELDDPGTGDEANDTPEDESSEDSDPSSEEEDSSIGTPEVPADGTDVGDTPEDDSASDEQSADLSGLNASDEEVLQNNSREELDALASGVGVEDPASYASKPKLLEAVRAKQAEQE